MVHEIFTFVTTKITNQTSNVLCKQICHLFRGNSDWKLNMNNEAGYVSTVCHVNRPQSVHNDIADYGKRASARLRWRHMTCLSYASNIIHLMSYSTQETGVVIAITLRHLIIICHYECI